jgi:hypothetical protein
MDEPSSFFKGVTSVPSHCLVLRPFAHEFDDVWSVLVERLRSQYSCKDAKEFVKSGAIMKHILEEMARADVVIFDVTGGNPNVFYELGIAHVIKGTDKVLLLKQNGSAVPFDVVGYRFLSYDPSAEGLERLQPRLLEHVKAAAHETFWYVIPENQRKELETLRGRDDRFYRIEIYMAAFAHDAVTLEVTLRPYPTDPNHQVCSQKMTLSVGENFPLRPLPWYLRFERFEPLEDHTGASGALLCIIPAVGQRVFVALLDEGVDCWRPVDAEHVIDDQYVLSGPIPEGEVWEFQPGETVQCREQTFQDGATGLVAVARVQRDA